MSLVVTVSYEPDGSPSLRDRSFEMKVQYQCVLTLEAGLVCALCRTCVVSGGVAGCTYTRSVPCCIQERERERDQRRRRARIAQDMK